MTGRKTARFEGASLAMDIAPCSGLPVRDLPDRLAQFLSGARPGCQRAVMDASIGESLPVGEPMFCRA
ncbi:hypothetical protein [Roseibium sp. LAB1]